MKILQVALSALALSGIVEAGTTVRLRGTGQQCSERSDCLSVDKCVDADDATKSLCRCKENKCKKQGYDCLTRGNGSGRAWACEGDLLCVGGTKDSGRERKWGRCKTATEIACAGCDGGYCQMGVQGCHAVPDDETNPQAFCEEHDGTFCPATSEHAPGVGVSASS